MWPCFHQLVKTITKKNEKEKTGLAASHYSKDPPSLAYWLFASPQLNSVRWCCRGRAKREKKTFARTVSSKLLKTKCPYLIQSQQSTVDKTLQARTISLYMYAVMKTHDNDKELQNVDLKVPFSPCGNRFVDLAREFQLEHKPSLDVSTVNRVPDSNWLFPPRSPTHKL